MSNNILISPLGLRSVDLIPFYCSGSTKTIDSKNFTVTVKNAILLSQTNKYFYSTICSDTFWHHFVSRIEIDTLWMDVLPKAENYNWLELIKRQFNGVIQWTKHQASVGTKICHPIDLRCSLVSSESEAETEMIYFSPEGFIAAHPINDYTLVTRFDLPESEHDCYLSDKKASYVYAASSGNFIAASQGDFRIFIFAKKSREYLLKFVCPGNILQMNIRNEDLYVRVKCKNEQKLLILNLNSLEEKPKEIVIPMEDSPGIFDGQNYFCFGQTHLVAIKREEAGDKMMIASFKELKAFTEGKGKASPWIEKELQNKTKRFESSKDRVKIFKKGKKFVIVVWVENIRAFKISEIQISKENSFSVEEVQERISMGGWEKVKFSLSAFIYKKGHLLVAYSDGWMDKIVSYEVKTKNVVSVASEEAFPVSNLGKIGLFSSELMHSTAFKIYYLKTVILPAPRSNKPHHLIVEMNFGRNKLFG